MITKEKRNEYAKKYRERHREELKELAKKWYNDNKEKARTYYKDNREKCLKNTKMYSKEHKEEIRNNCLTRRYGITYKEYNERLKVQNGVCLICGKSESRALSVDHNHETGKIRGLLCTRCNAMIAFAKDNKEILIRAVDYLQIKG